MALETWNGRTSSQTDADSPLDTTLMDGLRKDLDHLRQVLYGSTDPNFHTPIWGHNHDGANSNLVVLASQTAGNYYLGGGEGAGGSGSITVTVYTKYREVKVGVGGTFRIKFYISTGLSDGLVYGRIYRNGVAIGTARQTGTNATFSEDIGGWSPGDLIQLYCKYSGAPPDPTVGNLTVYTGAPPIIGRHNSY